MSLTQYALSGNISRFLKDLDKVKEETGKNKVTLFFNFINCFLKTGGGYSDYLNYKFYNKTSKELKEYATIKHQDTFYELVSPSEYKTAFTIKYNFLNNFKKYINRDFFYQGTKEELKEFLNKHPQFMYKPVDGLGGHGVRKMSIEDIKNFDEFYNGIVSNGNLVEELIVQHEEISKFASKSVNTLRIMTFNYRDHSEILEVMMRIGDGDHDVDNFHQNGMGVLVDKETGKLIGKAINKNNEEYEYHPKSNIKFDGFQIPNWEIIKNTVLEASKVNEHIHVVGWDVAVTKDGCTLVEGNRRPGFDLPQVLYKRGRKDMMQHCLDIINKYENTNYKI